MKIIHTGDIHIGSALKNLPREKAALRKAELAEGFARLCAYAKETGVRAVLIAGDLFDENGVAESVKKQTYAAIAAASPVCFFYVSGNHDARVTLEGKPDNLYTFENGGTWKSYDLGENVLVTGLDAKYFSESRFRSLSLPAEAFHLVLLHGDIHSAQGGGYIPLETLRSKPIDYLALGHIHEPMRTAEPFGLRGRYRYCGCNEGRGFDEIGPRGFFLLQIENGRLREEKFLSFAGRTLHERRADISACERYADVEAAAFAATRDLPATDMVKLTLCGGCRADLRKDTSLLSERLNARFFAARVEDETRLAFSLRDYENDFTERGEFVREVGGAEASDELKEAMLEVGLKALCGEEIDL